MVRGPVAGGERGYRPVAPATHLLGHLITVKSTLYGVGVERPIAVIIELQPVDDTPLCTMRHRAPCGVFADIMIGPGTTADGNIFEQFGVCTAHAGDVLVDLLTPAASAPHPVPYPFPDVPVRGKADLPPL